MSPTAPTASTSTIPAGEGLRGGSGVDPPPQRCGCARRSRWRAGSVSAAQHGSGARRWQRSARRATRRGARRGSRFGARRGRPAGAPRRQRRRLGVRRRGGLGRRPGDPAPSRSADRAATGGGVDPRHDDVDRAVAQCARRRGRTCGRGPQPRSDGPVRARDRTRRSGAARRCHRRPAASSGRGSPISGATDALDAGVGGRGMVRLAVGQWTEPRLPRRRMPSSTPSLRRCLPPATSSTCASPSEASTCSTTP
jgi:hypothetical protein